MPPIPGPSSDDFNALSEVIGYLTEGVAVFGPDATLSVANDAFFAMYPGMSDVLKPGVPWSIFLREASNRSAIPEPVCRQLDAIESGLIELAGLSEPIQMPAGRGMVYKLRLASSSDGGFVLTQNKTNDGGGGIDVARDAEILLRKVLEACPASLTMSRVTDGQIIYRSPAATDLLGAVKSSFAHFAHPEERADFVTFLLPDARVDNMRVSCLRADGKVFPAEISARLIDYRGEDVIVANIEDLTGELAVKAKLDRQKEQLFQSEKLSALGELLAGVAHELNNPLSIIVGNAEILHEELENSGLERRVGKLSQAAHRCVRIVRSFLALARQEPLDLRPVAPAKLIDMAIEAVSSDAKKAQIRIVGVHKPDVPSVIADEVQMVQVIINLLTNAVHALQSVDAEGEISVDCLQNSNAGTACITVTDNGPGVPEDIKTRIFDPLFTTKDAGKGTGVGLAYCHRIVAAHKGQIRLESIIGKGARFAVDLPLATVDRS